MAQQRDLFHTKDDPLTRDALGFLDKFSRRTRGNPFSAEDVTLAALKHGIVFQDMRAWGPVFVQARSEGLIRRVPVPFPRAMGHGTLTLGWVRAQ